MLLEIRSQGIETEKPRKVIQFPFHGHQGRISMYGSDRDSVLTQEPPSQDWERSPLYQLVWRQYQRRKELAFNTSRGSVVFEPPSQGENMQDANAGPLALEQ